MGDFDLSVSSMLSAAGALVVVLIVNHGWGWGWAVAVTFVFAGLFGLINGVLVAYVGTPSFITTLATGVILAGIEYTLTSGRFVTGTGYMPDSYRSSASASPTRDRFRLAGVGRRRPGVDLWLCSPRPSSAATCTPIGGNPEAARLSGIRVGAYGPLGFVITHAARRSGRRHHGSDRVVDPQHRRHACCCRPSPRPSSARRCRGAASSTSAARSSVCCSSRWSSTGLTFMGYQEDVQNIAQGMILVGAILISRLGAARRCARPTPPSHAAVRRSRAVTKRYPGVLAVDEVTLDLGDQQVVGLVGKNGAGKSTLIKVLAGAVRPDAGHVAIDGHEVVFHEPHQSTHAGLAFVHQELPGRAPAHGGRERDARARLPRHAGVFVDWSALNRRAAEVLARLEVDIDPTRRGGVAQHRPAPDGGDRPRARPRARMVVLDEPTASLSDEEIAHLYAVIRRLRSEGVGIVYVSHRLDEIFTLTERVVVMRNARVVADEATSDLDRRALIALITGHEDAQTAIERRRDHGVGGAARLAGGARRA